MAAKSWETNERSSVDELTDGKDLDKFDYVRFTFADLNGLSRAKTIPKEHVKEFLEGGLALYSGSLVLGSRGQIGYPKEVAETKYSNMLVRPMPGTLHSLPWAGAGAHVHIGEFLCETFWMKPYRNGGPQAACPRFMARNQLDRLFDLGYTLYSTHEAEFSVFEKDLETPIFSGKNIYSNLMMDRHGTLIYEIERRMRESGVDLQALQVEYGGGQFEISLEPVFGIAGADQMFRFKDGVKAISYQHGRVATFMTKPLLSGMASGLHYNHSVWSKNSETNAFHDPSKPDGLSTVAKCWIAGLVTHARAITALLSPTVNCYRRFGEPFAPSKADWGIDARFCAYRVKNYGPRETYVENRIPSGAANPYLVLAATVAAGIDGITRNLECPPPEQKDDALPLARSLEESLTYLEQDDVIVASLGEEFVRWFTAVKRDFEIKETKEFDVDSKEAFAKERELYLDFV